MVPADSQQIPRARCYSGKNIDHTTTHAFTYGTNHPLRRTIPDASTDTRKSCSQLTACKRLRPTTPHTQPLPGITRTRFSLIRYRSPLHTESQLFSSPAGTEMFHFPAYTPTQAMYSPAGHTTQLVRGFPIRTSSDQRFVGNSPRHNAASHVLHRPSMPRHPPYALDQQHTQTITHILKHNKQEEITHKPNPTNGDPVRCSRPLSSSHTPHPHTTPQPTKGPKHSTQIQAHTTTACCPRHPTACQHTNSSHIDCATHTATPQSATPNAAPVHVHLDFLKHSWQPHPRRLNQPHPTTAGH